MPETADARLAPFLDAYEREHATTRKVLGAYPAAQADFKPHERSNTAKTLAWTFVIEERMLLLAITEGEVLGKAFIAPPATWDEQLATFDAQSAELVAALRTATTPQLERSVQFFSGPQQLGDYPMMDFLWFILHDQIHHRGQLSVYLRMVGGHVPSIYGPSADEPWR